DPECPLINCVSGWNAGCLITKDQCQCFCVEKESPCEFIAENFQSSCTPDQFIDCNPDVSPCMCRCVIYKRYDEVPRSWCALLLLPSVDKFTRSGVPPHQLFTRMESWMFNYCSRLSMLLCEERESLPIYCSELPRQLRIQSVHRLQSRCIAMPVSLRSQAGH
ncbi:hypothetical protein MRX96_045671, partial [Rhipicephalus microplus]